MKIPPPRRILMTSPEYFEVAYVINAHMAGNVGAVDRERARAQWETLRDAYVSTGLAVAVLDGAAGLSDMVFCANQCLPYRTPDGELGVVISRMHAPQRKPEVEHYARYFEARGYRVRHLDDDLPGDFEGMGDALWHPGAFKLYGGYGYRTDREVYTRFADKLRVAVVPLELTDPDFYHLDTCLSLLDEHTALYYPGAFTDAGLGALRQNIPHLIPVGESDARERMACNAHCPDGRHVILHRGSDETNEALRRAGYEVIEVDTSEYLKSGGSVFCMKLAYW